MRYYNERVHVSCTSNQKRGLEDRAREWNLPTAVILRELLDAFLEKRDMRTPDEVRAEYISTVEDAREQGVRNGNRARDEQVRQSRVRTNRKDHPWRKERIIGRAERRGGQ